MTHPKKNLRSNLFRGGFFLSLWLISMAGVNIWNLSQVVAPIHQLRDEILVFNRFFMKLSESTSKSYRHFNHLFLCLGRGDWEWSEQLIGDVVNEQQVAKDLLRQLRELPLHQYGWGPKLLTHWTEYVELYERYLQTSESLIEQIHRHPTRQEINNWYQQAYSVEARGMRTKILELEESILKVVRATSRELVEISEGSLARAKLLLGVLWLLGTIMSVVVLRLSYLDLVKMAASLFQDLRSAKELFESIFETTHESAGGVRDQAKDTAERLSQIVNNSSVLQNYVDKSFNLAKEMRELANTNRQAVDWGSQSFLAWRRQMQDIQEESLKVQNVVAVIDDIAFQINLLALNAAVEAARAGDQGRGFAVVAEAIRNLAQKSAMAVDDIRNLSGEIVRSVQHSDESGRDVIQAFDQLQIEVVRLNDLNQEIATGAEEQSGGLKQINEALQQVTAALQANAERSADLTEMVVEAGQERELLALGMERFAKTFGVTRVRKENKLVSDLSNSEKSSFNGNFILRDNNLSDVARPAGTSGKKLKSEIRVSDNVLDHAESPRYKLSSPQSSQISEGGSEGPGRTRVADITRFPADDDFWSEAIEKIEKRKKAS